MDILQKIKNPFTSSKTREEKIREAYQILKTEQRINGNDTNPAMYNPFMQKQNDGDPKYKSKFKWLWEPQKGVRWDFDPIQTRSLAQDDPWAQMLVTSISKEISNTPWQIVENDETETSKNLNPFEKVSKGLTGKQAGEDEVIDFLKNPNPNHDFTDLCYMWMSDWLEVGSISGPIAFDKNDYSDDELTSNDPTPVHILPSDPVTWTKEFRSKTGVLDGFWQYAHRRSHNTTGSGGRYEQPIWFENIEVVWSDLNPRTNRRYGLPPTQTVSDILKLLDLTVTQEKNFWARGGFPAGMLKSNGDISEITALKEQKSEMAGKPNEKWLHVSDPEAEWLQIGVNWKEMEMTEREKWYAKVISSAFQVPVSVVGLKPEDINRACYTEDTEVLTENGFKNYWEVDDDEKIAVYDFDKHELKYEIPKGLVEYEVNEEIVNLENTRTSMSITKDHKVLYTPRHIRNDESQYRLDPFNEISPQDIRLRTAPNDRYDKDIEQKEKFELEGIYSRTRKNCRKDIEFDIDNWLEFLGYFLSEGCLSHRNEDGSPLYEIKFKQADELGKIIPELLGEMGIEYKTFDREEERKNWSDTTVIKFYDKRIWKYLRENCGSYSGDRSIPKEFMDLPNPKLRILLNSLIAGDGRKESMKNWWYGTTSKELADDVQEIAFKLGYGSRISIDEKENPKHSRAYKVHILKDDGHVVLQRDDKRQKFEEYEGKVWCFSTSTGVFVTRKNGKIAIQGNTFEGERENFESNTLGPYLQKLERVINDQIIYPFFGRDIRFEFQPGMSENQKSSISNRVVKEFNQNLVTRNEARRQLGYEEKEEDGFKDELVESDEGEPSLTDLAEMESQKKQDEPLRETSDWQEFSYQPSDVDDLYEELAPQVRELFDRVLENERVTDIIETLANDKEGKGNVELSRIIREAVKDLALTQGMKETIMAETSDKALDTLLNATEDTGMSVTEDKVMDRIQNRDMTFTDDFAKRMEDEIRDTVADGWEQGQSVDEIKDNLKEKGEEFSDYQARRISRTEMQRSTSQARAEFADENNLAIVWQTAEDDRVRDGHEEMNGSWKRSNEKWPVPYPDANGEVLEDTIGSSRYGINCRCSAILRPEEELDESNHVGVVD